MHNHSYNIVFLTKNIEQDLVEPGILRSFALLYETCPL